MRRRAKVLLLVGLAAAGGVVAFAGAIPEGFQTVSAIVSDPPSYVGREVHIKAIVAAVPFETGPHGATFSITDEISTLRVRWPGSLPDAFEAGRTVVVAGVLVEEDGSPVLHAHDIQGGCASRYEPTVE
ncbi:MAG TPA: cytochrome c maturation protein CcmE [Candidatus Thermoplasmatota archaeon]|nr:cytochrome c maturation protein CcmE [Candidatus Thermoplasmatota archaeon]